MPKAVPKARQFIDISGNNNTLNPKIYEADGYKHVSLKTSEGTGYCWYAGAITAQESHRVGLHCGHYHWLTEGVDPLAQADFFVENLKDRLGKKPTPGVWPPDGDWLMTDLERGSVGAHWPGDAERARELKVFNGRVMEKLPGYPLFTYAPDWYVAGNPALTAECKKWVIFASNYSNIDHLPNPYNFEYAAWQNSDRVYVAGISGAVDHNFWFPQPNMTDYKGNPTFGEKVMLKVARAVVISGLRAYHFGGKHGFFDPKRFPHLIHEADHGVGNRLRDLETRIAELEKGAKP